MFFWFFIRPPSEFLLGNSDVPPTLDAALLCRSRAGSDLGLEDKQGIKFKEGAIKCCKEKKVRNEWRNIPLIYSSRLFIRQYKAAQDKQKI